LTQRRVGLDAYAEDLAAREAALAAKLRSKDEELEKLVAQRTQELEQKHKEALEAHITDHASKLKEAVDAAEAAEAAKNKLAGKVEELEADLEKHGKEISTLKADREKTLHSLAEMHTTISGKIKELSAANGSIADLKLKLTMLEETLEISRPRERTLTTDLQNEKNLPKSAAANYNDFEKGVKIWTERLVDVAQRLDAELSTMGLPNFSYSSDERVSTSARLTMFFEGMVDTLKLLRSNRAVHLANESRKLYRTILSKVLMKVAHRNPGLNLTNVLASLPENADLKALEELVAPIVDRVSGVKRVEGQRRD
jgi:DNA repair exonuclease SbcCD ATPase subunit